VNAEPTNPGNVFLIGFRCTGKSSVGKLLAARVDWPFVDIDSVLASESGQSIKEIVETHGWETFRKMEHGILAHVCTLNRRIVASGGGVVLDHENVALMRKSGRVVWLRAEAETIKKRMLQDRDTQGFRPALTSKDRIAEIEATMFEREPYYRRAMDFHVDTDKLSLDQIADSIIENLRIRFSYFIPRIQKVTP
jgi:shikimate kinase